MMVACSVLVSILARVAPQELPTHRTSAFLSVPMRRGPCDHGNGLSLGRSLKLPENINAHDELRRDPVMAVLAGKLAAGRANCAPVAGKSTLNRLELSRAAATRYHKVAHDPAAIESLFVTVFLEAHKTPPTEIVLDVDATDDPLHGHQEGRFFHGYYDCYCYLPLYVVCGRHLLAAKLRPANIDARPARLRRSPASWRRFGRSGRIPGS